MDSLRSEKPMIPNFLVSEQVVRENGTGPTIDFGPACPGAVALTFGITSVVEQQSIDLALYGSADGETFDDKPLASFPQKFYCGTYSLVLDLSARPDVRYIRAGWKTNRWGRGDQTPLFSIYVFAETANPRVMAAAS
jgi:hypothetical protein